MRQYFASHHHSDPQGMQTPPDYPERRSVQFCSSRIAVASSGPCDCSKIPPGSPAVCYLPPGRSFPPYRGGKRWRSGSVGMCPPRTVHTQDSGY
eukprot:7222730-Prymnesium_polylepis.1